ncbi:MAG: hypothetical protein M3Y87_30920 [Myxococcota bacterium]|nr:hypothetical protein [Myxococcota bacterium]
MRIELRRLISIVAVSIVALLGTLACSGSPTELIVEVSTDLDVPSELDAFVITLVRPDGTAVAPARAELAEGGRTVRTLVLLHRGGALGPMAIRVAGELGDVEVLATERRASFVAGATTVLRVVLSRMCVGRMCPEGQTCGDDGACRPIDLEPCERDPASCASDAGPADGGIDGDGGATDDAGTCIASDALCGVLDVHLPGDRLAPVPCRALPSGVAIEHRVLDPSGAELTRLDGPTPRWALAASGAHTLEATASGAAGSCTARRTFDVAALTLVSSMGRPEGDPIRGIAARVGMAFVATGRNPYAVTESGWRDLTVDATGDPIVHSDLAAVTVRGDVALFAPVGNDGVLTRAEVASDFSSIVFTDVALPTSADWSGRDLAVPIGGAESGDRGPVALAAKDGVVLLDGDFGTFTPRRIGTRFDPTAAIAIGSRDLDEVGGVWAISSDSLYNRTIAGAGAELRSGGAVMLGSTMAQAVAIDDRTSPPFLSVCSLDLGLQVYALEGAWLTGSVLPAPHARIATVCRDVVNDRDGTLWIATTAGILRADGDGANPMRLEAPSGAPTGSIDAIAIAWSATARELWVLTSAHDVYRAVGSPPLPP